MAAQGWLGASAFTFLIVLSSSGGVNHLLSLNLIVGLLGDKHLQLQLTAISKACLGSLEGKAAFSICIRATIPYPFP